MKTRNLLLALAVAFGFTGGALAKAPADATGECKDGTYTQSEKKEGACSGHGGVKEWLAKAKAEAPAKPANATGECKDGTYTDTPSKSGACSGHKGVKTWYGGDAKPAAKPEAKEKSTAAAPADKVAPEKKPTQATGTSSDRKTNEQPWVKPATAAAGGGPGKVWVNKSSKVYHCEKDEWYGKTKEGEYMTEAQAKTSGARAAAGKACS